MAFSSGGDGHDKVNATINIVPLVDVMLVLLIIIMVTAPLMAHKVKVELPEANLDERPDTSGAVVPITIAVTDNGDIFLNDSPVTLQLLESSLAVEAQKTRRAIVGAFSRKLAELDDPSALRSSRPAISPISRPQPSATAAQIRFV